MNATAQAEGSYQPRPLIDLVVSIIIPSVILMKLSGPDDLGPVNALLIALAFPITWGFYEIIRHRHFNFIALLGLISVFLTGGIGLLELDTRWLAVKEAAIPGVIGVAVLLSTFTRYPLVKTLIFSPKIFDTELIRQRLEQSDNEQKFESRLQLANYFLSSTFLFSSVTNYVLAIIVVTSPAGTPEFNEQLGQMALLSYPVIAIPSMLMMIGIMYYLWRTINGLTGLGFEQVLVNKER